MRIRIPGFKTALALGALAGSLLILGPDSAKARQDKPKAKAWLGVAVQDVTESVARKNKLADENGAYVSQVTDDSPADSAGIRKGDVIVEFNRKQVEDADALVKEVGKLKSGDKADVAIVRKGDKKSFSVVLGKLPRSRSLALALRRPGGFAWMLGNHSAQGMQLMEMNDQLSEYFGVTGGSGVLVEKVEHGTAADKAGIKAGDVLQKIRARSIDDLEDVTKALRKVEDGDKIAIDVLRKGQTKSLTLEVQGDDVSSEFEFFRGDGPDVRLNRIPHFDANAFSIPRWNSRELQLDLEDVTPKMDELKERMHHMMQDLRDHRGALENAVRVLRVRTV